MIPVKITTEYITLQQLLKMTNWISSGGEAKYFLIENEVYVNSVLEQRRGRKLYTGNIIQIQNQEFEIV